MWLTNSSGQVLLAQRSLNKVKSPDLWGPVMSGTVAKDESYQKSARKEITEELGIEGIGLIQAHKAFIQQPRRFFCQWYRVIVDSPLEAFNFQQEEVEQLLWIEPYTLVGELAKKPHLYTSLLQEGVNSFLSQSPSS